MNLLLVMRVLVFQAALAVQFLSFLFRPAGRGAVCQIPPSLCSVGAPFFARALIKED